MVFLKTCFNCGKKTEKTYENMCETCFKQINPPIANLKPINFKICNFTKQICYNSYYYPQEEILEMLPNIVKKKIEINPKYNLNQINIKDFQIVGHKVSFDIEVDCNLKE